MNELRRDPFTGQWAVLAPGRGARPGAVLPAAAPPGPTPAPGAAPAIGPSRDPGCPFCPGNEDQTPPALWVEPVRLEPGAVGPAAGGPGGGAPGPWQVRVVPNRFPALAPGAGAVARMPEGPLWRARPARGAHEVVIESPLHNARLADFTMEDLTLVLKVYRDRLRHLARRPGVRYVALFRNEGREAGASLAHPHAQLVALPVVPPDVRRRWEAAARYRRRRGSCPTCDLLEGEEREGLRWAGGNPSFAALCPFAPRFADEVWIVPRRHRLSLASFTEGELEGLARLLRAVLRALRETLGDPPFNLVAYEGPPPGAGRAARAFHCFFQLVPRLTRIAGFEVGTGLSITTRRPEDTAAQLRGILQRELAGRDR